MDRHFRTYCDVKSRVWPTQSAFAVIIVRGLNPCIQ